MFSLHETTQRRVCRTAFVLGCVLPTLCAIAWVTYLHRPWRESDWQQMLRQQLHVQATVGEVRSPSPGITELVDLEFSDLRSGQLLGSIDELRITGWASKTALAAARVEISAEQFPAFASVIATWLASEDDSRLQMQAETLRLVGPRGELFELANIRLQSLVGADTHKQIKLLASPIETGEGTRSTVQLIVDHDSTQSMVTLETQNESLPAWLLADLVPGMGGCAGASFTGRLQIASTSQQPSGSMTGRLEGIDLQSWVGSGSPHQLRGTASLHLESLKWKGPSIEIARGHLRADAGKVSHSLLALLSERHYFPLGQQLEGAEIPADRMLDFDELACHFQISRAGIEISGACETSKSGSSRGLLANDGQLLLREPKYRVLQVARLVQVLATMQPEASWLPATREALEIATRLPLPESEGSAKEPLKKESP